VSVVTGSANRRTSNGGDVNPVGGLEAVLDATRALLWIESPADASLAARRLITDLGGGIMPARVADSDALPIDVAFGDGEPVLPTAPPLSVARMLLERYLPSFMVDARRALELADKTVRLAEDASIDSLTGLVNRRQLDRLLARLRPEDTVIILDLDHFKTVNDTFGHPEGDRVLEAFGATITANLRARDHAGRYGGEEFVILLAGGGEPGPFLERLRSAWESARVHPISFSAGIAPARPDLTSVFEAADRALYRAKSCGRGQWQWATEGDYA
jgi:diguanylate cyclase (GGDEF)-like protein